MKSAITLCQVSEASGGPFVFRTPLPEAFATAAAIGFDAVELFLPGPDFITPDEVLELAAKHQLAIAAVGTGAGMLRHGLTLADPDPSRREAAEEFIFSMIDFGGPLGAPAILGSMQGKAIDAESPAMLADALRRCAARAANHGVPFIYEPLNRYETNLINRIPQAVDFLANHRLENVLLLADLFHMNIEETDPATSIYYAQSYIGHVHFADSNRQAIGFGHTNLSPIIGALREIGYDGYLSAEILPLPDPETAARQTISSFLSLTQQ